MLNKTVTYSVDRCNRNGAIFRHLDLLCVILILHCAYTEIKGYP